MSLLLAPKTIVGRVRRSASGVGIAAVCVLVILLIAVIGPWITPLDPEATNLMATNAGPSTVNWFGTDDVGRDILSRLLHGAQMSLVGPFAVMLL